ncbi:GGDEF domain-containing protein [Sphingomonas sp.]|uniref:GGDEF domain-containing protein n=1 Tax=Sphingomonas sp. TaxID=28214 RepID=UPI0025DED5B9|nr:GGDEF domain-containing protein [Sphingomonas sp.]MBV9528941.1 GGDEF domain-containing protein [Sphingomonas sp.]
MIDEVIEAVDSDRLIEEVSRLQKEVTQLRQRVEQLDTLAHQDSLCDLPNRRGFMRALERVIDRVKRYAQPAALLFVDLDGLKMINDNFGHCAGDEALIQVSRLLVGGVRRSDLVARIGGDEFAILVGQVEGADAHDTATRLVDLIAGCEFMHDGRALPLSVAIGVGMIQADDTPEAAIARADAEMYRRKVAA